MARQRGEQIGGEFLPRQFQELRRFVDVNQRVAKVVVVGQGRGHERLLQVRPGQPFLQGAADQVLGVGRSLGLDGFEEGLPAEGRARCGVGMKAVAEGWVEKLRYMLWEDEVTEVDALAFAGGYGVLLQGAADGRGRSSNPHIASMQGPDGRWIRREGSDE